jgi:phosphate butyryltransferase
MAESRIERLLRARLDVGAGRRWANAGGKTPDAGGRSAGAPMDVPVVAVPMANNPEVIGAIGTAIREAVARFVLVGPVDEIRRLADADGVDLAGSELCEERDGQAACARAATMASRGEAQVLMKGLVQTADFVRSILDRSRGLVPPGGLLSHVALCDIDVHDRLIYLTDAAITTYPEAAQKVLIVENALRCALALGAERPRCAMIAPVEKVSDRIPSTTDAVAVVEAFADDPRIDVGGPFGLDVAISVEAAAIKGIGGSVAGRADILVLPNIDAGNAVYKALTWFARARVAGIVSGASAPVVLTSRADSEESKLNALRFALAVAAGESRR